MRDKIYTMTVPVGNCLIWVGASLRNGYGRRLTEAEKEYIRSSTKSQRELAKELGCTQPAISKIRNKV